MMSITNDSALFQNKHRNSFYVIIIGIFFQTSEMLSISERPVFFCATLLNSEWV